MQEQKLGTILWRGKLLIAVSLVLCVVLAFFVTKTSAKVYQATAIIQVTAPTGGRTGDPFQDQQANQGLATTYATLIVDRSFLEKIRARVGNGQYTVTQLARRISASAVKDTALIRINVEGASPEQASSLAADVAQTFLAVVRQDATGRNGVQKKEIEDQIARISAQIERLVRSKRAEDVERLASLRLARAALTQQLAQLVTDAARQSGSVSLTAPPTASFSPIRPRPALNIAAGVMLGLLLGVLLAWLRSRLDRALRTAEEAEELVAAPLLAAIPLRKRYAVDDAVLGEAYDVLRANLAFLSLDQAMQVITFTSYNPGEGKTSSVEGLAYAAVRGGMSVLLVDADVRTSNLSSQFGARAMPGLTSVIVGTSRIEDSVLEIVPGLSLLPAGPTPPNPPSLLSSGRMREVLAELRDRHSLVIIDAPPVAHLADASILAGISDGVVLIARVGVTNRSDLPSAVANLRHSPTPIVGVVVLRPQMIDESYYPVQNEGRESVGDVVVEY
jgi:non-specific protein-tyrosine kinase